MSAPSLKILVGVGLALCAVAVMVMAAQVLMVLFGGVLLGIVLFDCSHWAAQKTHLSRGLCLTVLVVLGLGLFATALYFSGALLSDQLEVLAHALPDLLHRAQAYAEHVPIGRKLAALLSDSKLGEQVMALPKTALAALSSSFELLGACILVFFVAIYGAAQPELHERALLGAIPKRHHAGVRAALRDVHHTLGRWMLGRLVAMLFVGVSTGIAFHFLHVPAAFVLALFAGVLTFVEYAGAILSAIPPFLLSLAHGSTTALAVLALFTALHIIEGYVLTPLLARIAVHFPPAYAIAAQAIFGVLLGPLGLTFSTPILVAVTSAIKALRNSHEASARAAS